MHHVKREVPILMLLAITLVIGAPAQSKNTPKDSSGGTTTQLITFVELGSVKCVPCRMMQPVMKNIEDKYGSQIRVLFHDVWKEDQKKYAKEYGIQVIPTQVFLDKEGKEVFRHEGYFPESEIDALLAKHGLKPNS
jgi:thioredoxin 1